MTDRLEDCRDSFRARVAGLHARAESFRKHGSGVCVRCGEVVGNTELSRLGLCPSFLRNIEEDHDLD